MAFHILREISSDDLRQRVLKSIREDTFCAACQEYSTTYFKRISCPKTTFQIYGVQSYLPAVNINLVGTEATYHLERNAMSIGKQQFFMMRRTKGTTRYRVYESRRRCTLLSGYSSSRIWFASQSLSSLSKKYLASRTWFGKFQTRQKNTTREKHETYEQRKAQQKKNICFDGK